jgi:hypothetical protein
VSTGAAVNAPADAVGRSERRIALVKPSGAVDERVTHALQLLDSILWAFQGTTRSNWRITPLDVAQVVVVHEANSDERAGTWQTAGKQVIGIATEGRSDPAVSNTLVYPFRAAEVLALLERLDAQLSSPGEAQPPRSNDAPTDPWSFVEALRTLRSVQNSQAWLVGRDGRAPVLWLRGDVVSYSANAGMVQAIRHGSLRLSKLTLAKSQEPVSGSTRRSGVELSWFAGYHASNQLAPGLTAGARYRIMRWPNFGLIRPLPSQLRVAASLSSAAADLDEIIKRASVPVEEAMRTLNALYACDVLACLGVEERVAAATSRALPAPNGGFTKFLRNVRKHLGLGG